MPLRGFCFIEKLVGDVGLDFALLKTVSTLNLRICAFSLQRKGI